MNKKLKKILFKIRRAYYRNKDQHSGTHASLAVSKIGADLQLRQLKTEETEIIFKQGTDTGYHRYGTQWWTNLACPLAYKYLSLDAMYAPEYFDETMGHPSHAQSLRLYTYMQETYAKVFGKNFSSVLELGTGGGEITRHFHEAGLDLIAVEGTSAGVQKLLSLGIPEHQVLKRNLKFFNKLDRTFDLAMCTEVAEHIEPWFASKIVENCVSNANVVWFSAARGNVPPHYHHINEAPIEAWDNIFAHFGFNFQIPLNGTMGRADRLYLNEVSVGQIISA
jgi:Methyltransferase domain